MKKLLLLFFILLSHSVYAAVTQCGMSLSADNKTVVLFVNGITNSRADACTSSDELRKAIGTTNFDYNYLYNKTDGFLSDNDELRAQAKVSEVAFKQVNLNRGDLDYLSGSVNKKFQYYAALGGLYDSYATTTDTTNARLYLVTKSLRDALTTYAKYYDRIIVVPHSQGNFYTESAYSMLVSSGDLTTVNKIKVVGVASVAATTPTDTYLTNGGDVTVYGGQGFVNSLVAWLSVYKPLLSKDSYNYFGTASNIDIRAIATSGFHNFVKVYLSDLYYSAEKNNTSYRLIIRDYIQNYIVAPPISTTKQFQINAIAFQSQVGNQTQYLTGLVLYMPTSTEYDNATVSGLGTASQPDGIVRLKDNGLSYLQTIVTQYGLTTVGDSVLRLPNTLTSTEIPAGTQYTVKIYKGTTLVTTQTITLAGRVFSPSEMTAGMFSSLAPLTYAQLCPNNVATTATWYTTPSSIALDPEYTTPKGINATLFCSPTAPYTASARVEFGDNLNRRFMSTNTLVAP